MGIVERVSEVTQVTARADQRQLNKRDIYIVDDSAIEACLTLWGDHALEFDASNVGEVVAFKGVVVKEFGGSLILLFWLSISRIHSLDKLHANQNKFLPMTV